MVAELAAFGNEGQVDLVAVVLGGEGAVEIALEAPAGSQRVFALLKAQPHFLTGLHVTGMPIPLGQQRKTIRVVGNLGDFGFVLVKGGEGEAMEVVSFLLELGKLSAHKRVGSRHGILNFLPAVPTADERELAVLAIELLEVAELEDVGLEDLFAGHVLDDRGRRGGDD